MRAEPGRGTKKAWGPAVCTDRATGAHCIAKPGCRPASVVRVADTGQPCQQFPFINRAGDCDALLASWGCDGVEVSRRQASG